MPFVVCLLSEHSFRKPPGGRMKTLIDCRRHHEVTQFVMGRVVDGRPVYTMACYYVDGLLIDTGPVHVAGEIPAAFAEFPVHTIVNTHHHEDHIGNNAVFQEKLGVGPALAHEKAVPRIVDPRIWTGRLQPYQHFVWGAPPPSAARPIGEEVRTESYTFRVLHTPGHSDDHICLLEPERGWLFAGDLFISERAEVLRSDEDALLILDSLRRLLEYDFEVLFCASGLVARNARGAVAAKIAYWEDLKERAQALYRTGLDPEEIRERLLGPETALYGLTGGDFAKVHLVRSLLRI